MNTTEQLFEFLAAGVSSCHVVDRSEAYLKENGFSPLSMKQAWKIERGGKYYIRHHDTTLAAFTIGREYQTKDMSVQYRKEHRIYQYLSFHRQVPI